MGLNNSSIGVFDSGIGGLTVVKTIAELMPNEDIVYFGDIARLPYGTKSVATIRKFTYQTVKFLLQQNVKAIVIACNTISAVALAEVLQLAGDTPVVNVISACSATLSNNSKSRRVGVIATPATVTSMAYPRAIKNLNDELQVLQVACTLFVPLIEEGYLVHQALDIIAGEYLAPLIKANIDTLVLGCTHYPLIRPTLEKIMGDNVTIVDPAIATANELHSILQQKQLFNQNLKPAQYEFYVTELSPNFNKIGEIFLNRRLSSPKLINLEPI
ncbi:MAG: glutamate racemase [Burkholderiales bacterium]|nr:glutamate racemase [Burkholderiales bacterium]